MSFRGIDIRQSGGSLLFRAFLLDSSSAILTSGTTTLRLFELQSDGTLKSYDFSSNTFKTGALTTATLAMTHRTGNNGTYNTGIWTVALATLSGFTVGNIYLAQVANSGAITQTREFQFGGATGDLVPDAQGRLPVNAQQLAGQTVNAAAAVTFPASVGDATASAQSSLLSAVNAITTNTARAQVAVPAFVALPATGSTTVLFKLKLYNLQGQLEDADTNTVTVSAALADGTNENANLASTTMTRDSAGNYHGSYSLASNAPEGSVYLDFAWSVGSVAMSVSAVFSVAQADTVTSIAAIKAKTDNLPASPAAVGSAMTLTSDYDSAKVAASQASVSALPTAAQNRAEMDSNSTQLAKLGTPTNTTVSGDIAAALAALTALQNVFVGATVNDTGPAAASFKGASSLNSTNSFYVGSVLVFTSGTLKGVARKITGYSGATRTLAFATAFPAAPGNGDSFYITGRID